MYVRQGNFLDGKIKMRNDDNEMYAMFSKLEF